MDFGTSMRRKLKRFNAAARRSIAKREAGEVDSKPSEPQPTTWDEALKRALRKVRSKASRNVNVNALKAKPEPINAK
ncbi:hypothetical protein VN12_06140 [Pirellula sp. SH-Sr6A]|uniref:hypothetical protein n=1 Tax=Pirellula sp. SH-Sr6A TaxID=1632865 RepID=UPI00078C6B51|nr:hypothetical protein [Pirellula sp. SH-Sr6A]AMV31681.1 hypothetical protein VN12_06140 [Pirellula sp. SH-Sr6A]